MQSFDVFDTVLTRAVGAPESVFILLGKRLRKASVIPVPPHEFSRLRVEAEIQARRTHGWGEVTLDAIYRELGNLLALSEAQRLSVAQWECEMEEALWRAVPGAFVLVSEARRRHGGVIYISDMYLPASLIENGLARHALWQDGDRLYLSHDVGTPKASGGLFEHVLSHERLSPQDLTHRGNHPHGDLTTPARIGIRTDPFPEGNLNRCETLMETRSGETVGLSSVCAGASRLARLSTPAESTTEQTLRDVSAGVLAPVLTGFVLWVLRRSRELSLQRLYFLARDGQILLDIARRLAPKLDMDIELRYLYASRQSWHLPGITDLTPETMDWICMRYDSLTLRSLLFRVDLSPEDVAAELARAGMLRDDWDQQISAPQIERVKTLLARGRPRSLILAKAAEKRETLIGYLRQEGVTDDVPWSLVDVGWNGRLQVSLGQILSACGGPIPRGFYFGLANRPSTPTAGASEAYLFDRMTSRDRKPDGNVDFPTIMEMACAADHGTVIDFTQRDSRFEPVLREQANTPAIAWGLPVMQDTIRRFAEHVLLDDTLLDLDCDLTPMSSDIIRTFWETPTRREAEVWGQFPFENDQSGTVPQPIAQPYDAAAVIRAVLGRRMGHASVSFWQAGSMMISPPPVRVALQSGARVKRMLRKTVGLLRAGSK